MTATELAPGADAAARIRATSTPTRTRPRTARSTRRGRCADVWAAEPRDALFLYLHVPFCAMRCGFCNLFTTANPKDDLVAPTSTRCAGRRRPCGPRCPDARFARLAIGGGHADVPRRGRAGRAVRRRRAGDGRGPARDPRRRRDVAGHAHRRASWRCCRPAASTASASASRRSSRPRRPRVRPAAARADVDAALSLLAEAGFPTLNIDLIYGLPGQTVETWLVLAPAGAALISPRSCTSTRSTSAR